MTDRRNDPSALPLPPDLAGLHAELSSILIEERPSFGPELHAELESQWGTPTPGSGFRVRHAMAAAIGALLLVSVAAPQARAGLAKLLPWNQPSELGPVVERPVTHPDVTLPEQGPVVVASDEAVEPAVPPRVPEVGEETRLERPDNTYPELLDRARAERTIRDQYPLELQEAGIGGLVTLRVWVGSDGTVDQAQIERGSGVSEFDRVALDMAPSLRFEPARRFGEPVGTWVNFDLAFEPSEDSPAPLPPSPIESPAPPEDVGWEFSEQLFPGEYLTPPPTLFEGRQLLREALGDPIEAGGPLDNLEALLAGDPPVGFGITQWRSEAATALAQAMRSAPKNPAPALALARIRRKQGLRDEARRLYADGILRAEANSHEVSQGFLAELYYEQGMIIQEQWLAWEHLGHIAASELRKIDCRVASGYADTRYVTAEPLMGLNNLCPIEFREIMTRGFQETGPAEGETREDMLRSLSAAVEAVPSHPRANIELLLDAADRDRWGDLLKDSQRFIWESRGNPTGILLSGLALQRLGYPEEAMERFRVALDALPPAEAQRLRDIGALLPLTRLGAYAAMGDVERLEMERAFWSSRDPILTTDVNERETEHFARAAYATLRFGDLDSEAAEVLLRYGSPTSVRTVGEGSDLRTVFWDYGGGSNLTFVRRATSRHMDLTPESATYLGSLKNIFPHRYGSVGLREVRDLPGLVSQFRMARGGLEIEVHTAVPEKMYGGPSDSLHVSIFLLGEDQRVVSSSRQRVAAAQGDVGLRTWGGPEIRQVVLEIYDDRIGFLAAMREPVGLSKPGEDPRISDLLLVEAANPEPSEVRRTAAWVSPLTEGVTDEATVGVIFELYDLPVRETAYTVEAHLSADDGYRVPLYISPSGARDFRTTWRRRSDATVGVTEYVTVDLTEVEPGDYTLEIVATLLRALEPVRSTRRLTVR